MHQRMLCFARSPESTISAIVVPFPHSLDIESNGSCLCAQTALFARVWQNLDTLTWGLGMRLITVSPYPSKDNIHISVTHYWIWRLLSWVKDGATGSLRIHLCPHFDSFCSNQGPLLCCEEKQLFLSLKLWFNVPSFNTYFLRTYCVLLTDFFSFPCSFLSCR